MRFSSSLAFIFILHLSISSFICIQSIDFDLDPHVSITESINPNENQKGNDLNQGSNEIEDEEVNHVIKINDANYSENVWNHSILFLLFYTDWCYYSQEFLPTYSQVAVIIHQKLKRLKSSLDTNEHIKNLTMAFGIVDGDVEKDIMARFHISKYPTLKVVTWGRKSRHEYRGGRSVKQLSKWIHDFIPDHVIEMQEKDIQLLHDKISDINSKPIIAVFSKDDPMKNDFYKESLIKYSITLKDDCDFYWITINESNDNVINPNEFQDKLYFHPHIHTYIEPNSTFDGLVTDTRAVRRWLADKCDPLVTEITFENAEEVTESGIPMLVLFINPSHSNVQSMVANFIHAVYTELDPNDTSDDTSNDTSGDTSNNTSNVTAHYADGIKFNYALKRVGKDPKSDLPLLVLDDFIHIFTFDGNISDIGVTNGTLRKFVNDYNSGKLHEDYHEQIVEKIIKDADEETGEKENEVDEDRAKDAIFDIGKKVMDAIGQRVHDAMVNRTRDGASGGDGVPSDNQDGATNVVSSEEYADILLPGATDNQKVILDGDTDKANSVDGDDLNVFNSAPESVFVQLQPSVKRYTLLRDEL